MKRLDHGAVDEALAGAISWSREGDELVKERRGTNFADSLAYVVRVGMLAEKANHHPDVDIRWNVVTLRVTTHSEGGLTDKDLDLARAVDALEPLPGPTA
ncbi:MAG: 4a-hydroxytetrahydrobiopterin dehydratase [Acidimicrobiales bacterium]